ncbi:hypothetical protein K438DRAFT_516511 [Mycena galopus ATCC 62051]|nr:hypothetical protein K438DRAFT_516511 [Mycena galopus ATCC 62051]
MDPISVTTTFITLANFIRDLIEVGQSIKCSIEKVHENRKRIRDFTEDVLRALVNLEDLTRGREDTFHVHTLLAALGDLKADMLHVLSSCRNIYPVEHPTGIRALTSHIKAWVKREELEVKIRHLKEHVNKCYVQFTAFSTARIEDTSVQVAQTTLRVEQTLLVNNTENQVKLCRLEHMMAQVLLETQFGQNVLNQTMDIIASDPGHRSLESQYLSVQTTRLMDSFQQLLASGKLVLDEPLFDPAKAFQLVFHQPTPLHVLHQILEAVIQIDENPNQIVLQSMKAIVLDLGVHLGHIGMTSERIAWERLKIRILHYFGGREFAAGTVPHIAHALHELSLGYQQQLQFQSALTASQQSLDLWCHISESLPDVYNQTGHLKALTTHAWNLLETGQKRTALSTAQDAASLACPILEQIVESSAGSSSLVDEVEAVGLMRPFSALLEPSLLLINIPRHMKPQRKVSSQFSDCKSLHILLLEMLWTCFWTKFAN